ncbi:hypothetical protein, partial [uncultured Prevotella sp.]|uniref:hypothetical protein n=1 Tax=uncultured Prevotella sp. TaxID=159272 RepID=UPI0025958B7C
MKKITKFLDSVMGGIKRTCIAKALAVFAVASIAINANAQTVDDQGVVTGIDKLVGKTQDELLNKAVTSTTFPTDPEQQFFLYNVKTGRLLNAGGYWGTHVALKEYGKPLAVIKAEDESLDGVTSTRLKIIMEMKGTEGNFVGWCGVPGASGKNPADIGTYVDRNEGDVYGWVLEPVANDNMNTYRLRTFAHSQFDDKGVVINATKKYYLCSNKGVVDADRNCESYPEESLSQYAGYDQWRFLSYQQILDLQLYNADNLTDALELSFMQKCPGFSRGDNDIISWQTYNFATQELNKESEKFAIYGLQKYNRAVIQPKNVAKPSFDCTLPNEKRFPFMKNDPYTFDNVNYYKDKDDGTNNYQRNLAKYYCASITNKRGTLFQNIVITLPGTYKIECKGYSTTPKAALFAGVIDPQNTNKMLNESLNTTMLNQVSNMLPAVQNELHISEKNMDYAGKTFYSGNYNNVVYVTVPEDALVNGKATIRFGIMIGDGTDDKIVEDDEWTVFDDFRMLYASRTFDEDLILDEYRDNLKYLVDLVPVKNKTLRLKKDFTLNKWNSFILPVNLTKKQVIETFGASARLAELTNLTKTGIEFTSVKLDNDKETALEAYVPYLIFPVKGADQTKAYTAKYQQTGTTKRLLVNIADNHYVIDKVSMPLTADGKKNDFSKMDQEHWTTTVTGGNDDIKAYGTFARTFGTVQTDKEDGTYTWKNDGTIITGRPTLEHSYFFDKGNMYHSTGRPRGLRGFSCWFETTGAQNSLQLTIDGVSQGTTGIEDILADYEQPVSRFANGI